LLTQIDEKKHAVDNGTDFYFFFSSHAVDDNSNHWPIDRKILTKPNFDLLALSDIGTMALNKKEGKTDWLTRTIMQ
jgi:hypothetical protein